MILQTGAHCQHILKPIFEDSAMIQTHQASVPIQSISLIVASNIGDFFPTISLWNSHSGGRTVTTSTTKIYSKILKTIVFIASLCSGSDIHFLSRYRVYNGVSFSRLSLFHIAVQDHFLLLRSLANSGKHFFHVLTAKNISQHIGIDGFWALFVPCIKFQ